MTNCKFYTAGNSAALGYAVAYLKREGCTFPSLPADATHLLLPVPSFQPDGSIKGGGDLAEILHTLPKKITVIGGQLDTEALSGYQTIDLLKDSMYLAENAAITAHCALKLALENLPVTLQDCPVLVIGWGRIGKCLSDLLKRTGASVTVAARKDADRAMLRALGYTAVDTAFLDTVPYRVIFNTVPYMVCGNCSGDGLKIDLASVLGLGGKDVIWARGLPGKDAPESSGILIGQTAMRIIKELSI